MVKRGAHVTGVARDLKRLEEAEAYCRVSLATSQVGHAPDVRQTFASPDQQIKFISADLTHADTSDAALRQAMAAWGGHAPDHVYLCAGYSKPQFWIDAEPEALQKVSMSCACSPW